MRTKHKDTKLSLLALDKDLVSMSGSAGMDSSDTGAVRGQQLVCCRVIQPIVAVDRIVDQVPDEPRGGYFRHQEDVCQRRRV